MPSFNYTARDQKGAVQVGLLDAVTEDEVIAILQHRGLLVTSIARKDQRAMPLVASGRARPRRMHTGVKVEDHVLLCQQLATLIEAGVPLLKSLDVASMQVESRMLLLALDEIRRNVAAGKTLRDALAQHPRVFSPLWLNLVETGETSGHLAQSLNQLAHHFESEHRLQSEVKTALTYPAFLMVAAIAVLIVFMYVIIPKFRDMFATMNIELPPITKLVLFASDFARQYWVALLLGIGGGGYGLTQYLRTEMGQWLRDRLVLKLPVFSGLFVNVQIAEFTSGLSTLLESGVPLLSSLEILERSATNRVYGQAIRTVREWVKEGKPMAQPMAETGLFPPMAVQMVMVGEEVGELAKMIKRVARYYDERVLIFIARLTKLFEPIAIVVMAGLVGIIVSAIFMPIFKMASGANLR